MRLSSSIACAFLKKAPCRAASVLPIVTATGVASPSEHGQEITKTQTALTKENSTERPKEIHTTNVTSATKITKGTKTELTRSATRSIGAFVSETASTSERIFENLVCPPARTTRICSQPEVTIVAQETSLPTPMMRGRLSPVRTDSSTSASP